MGPILGLGLGLNLGRERVEPCLFQEPANSTTLTHWGSQHTFYCLFTLFWFFFLLEVVFNIHFILIFFAQNGEKSHDMFVLALQLTQGRPAAATLSPLQRFLYSQVYWVVNRQCYCHLEVYRVAFAWGQSVAVHHDSKHGITSEILGLFGN